MVAELKAATPVVPDPIKGSRMTSAGEGATRFMSLRTNPRGFGQGWSDLLSSDWALVMRSVCIIFKL